MNVSLSRWGVAGALALGACNLFAAEEPAEEPLQGVVEHESRRLAFELGGRLARVSAEVGDDVAVGSELASLDPALGDADVAARRADLDAVNAQLALLRSGARPEDRQATAAELRAAREQLRVVERQRDRLRGLASRGATPVAEAEQLEASWAAADARVRTLVQASQAQRSGARDEEIRAAEARVAASQAALLAAEVRVAHTHLVAPVAGTVIERLQDPGEVVAAGAPVLELAELDRPYVDVFVPQARIAEVQLGRDAAVRVDSLAEPLPGVVERIGQRTEFTPRYLFSERERPNLVVRVRVRVQDPGHQLRAGVPAFVSLAAVRSATETRP